PESIAPQRGDRVAHLPAASALSPYEKPCAPDCRARFASVSVRQPLIPGAPAILPGESEIGEIGSAAGVQAPAVKELDRVVPGHGEHQEGTHAGVPELDVTDLAVQRR